MYLNKAEQAHVLQQKGQFAKRPSIEKEIENLTPDELRAIWESFDATCRTTVCVRLKLKDTGGMPDVELIRGVLFLAAMKGRRGR
jgi:hypothetical protein